MKKHLLLLYSLLCLAVQGQCANVGKTGFREEIPRWDVWQRLTLKGQLYGKKTYQIRYVRDTNDEFRRGYIHFSSGKTRFATIKLPLTDFECKNFCVDSLMQTKRGFILLISWEEANISTIWNIFSAIAKVLSSSIKSSHGFFSQKKMRKRLHISA